MIWLTWRQFRGQALIALAALAALTVFLVLLGLRIRDTYAAYVTDCAAACSLSSARDAMEDAHFGPLLLSGLLVVLVPALIGAFWGAPLVSREIETGTHRLVWSQSITRTRWLAVKLTFVTLAGIALAAALSLLLTWAASPYDELLAGRFDPLLFPTRNIVPLGYAAFAVTAGTAIGLLTRRAIPAMAITLAVFAVLQILVPTAIRPHLRPAVTESVAFTPDTRVTEFSAGNSEGGGVTINGYQGTIPGAWMMSNRVPLFDASGEQVTRGELGDCLTGELDRDMACLAQMNLHFTVKYQPANRYWTFQWLEFGGYLLLGGALAAFAFWHIRRGLS
ncbi:transporter [Phytohabitans flavus]|uniref:Transporter n=1 Tax=Phytohabitans flavus TaxID=1076124 RepID=A0A6F8Y154_9ACTN|nr:ABC transporter permease subunit [Phytohabitans flavus]BCB79708.1 transporter [Phytohabitans flavus]